MLDSALSIPLKQMGLVTLFNGMDITQTRHYVKIHCTTYIKHICEKYLSDWMTDAKVGADRPLPLPFKESLLKEVTDTIGDADPKTQFALKDKHHVGYRNYKAGKSVMQYLYSNHNDGIYCWRSEPNDELPDHPFSSSAKDALSIVDI